jgi:penicillin-binding protein 2
LRAPGRILIGLVGVVFALLAIRAFQLQILAHSRYASLAEKNRVKIVTAHAPRGRIFSRDGQVVADSRPGYSISILPYQMSDTDTLVMKLSPVLGVTEEALEKRIAHALKRPLTVQRIARDVSMEVVSWVEEHKLDLPGVSVEVEPIRRYPFGEILCHLIGYVGEISPKGLEMFSDRGYKYGDMIGETGLEKEYEEYLRGQEGLEFVEVDARGREVGPFPDRRPVAAIPGDDLHLTIDSELQVRAAEALGNYQRGCIFGMNPANGEVLVYYSEPTFDPNLFAVGISQEEWDKLSKMPSSPMWDRVVQSAYPPGSIYKLVTAASALESGVVTRWTRFAPCTGSFEYGDRHFSCWSVHGRMNVVPAIVQSCDVYFYQAGIALGVDRLAETAFSMGFGKKTGIDVPDENSGLVPTTKWYNAKLGKRKWSKGVVLNVAIGQGEILCTAVQLCTMVASIAEGVKCRPHIVSRVVGRDGTEIDTVTPEREGVALGDTTLAILREAMYGAVNQPKGTGALAASLNFRVSGKTGTAEAPPREDHSLFVGFAPHEDPKICLVVIVENVGSGGSVAAPLAGRLLEHYLMSQSNGAL